MKNPTDRVLAKSRALWTPFFKGVTTLLLGLMLVLPAYADDTLEEKDIEITAIPIELNSENPQQKTVGKLKYIKGYHLTSEDDGDFGGISGITSYLGEIIDHESRLTITVYTLQTVTDAGHSVSIELIGNLPATIKLEGSIARLPNLPKNLRPKIAGDAEAITSIIDKDDNEYEFVAFEQQHRIVAYGDEEETPLPLPANIGQLQKNGGLETMETLSDGRLLLMAEHPTIKTKQHFGWIGTAPADDPLDFSYVTRLIAPPEGYSPTDATELPNGDVLVLLRRFTPLDGVSAKFWRIKKAILDKSEPITGEVIATLKPPLSVDNMEGIAVIDVSEDGNPIIAVISDDNFNSFQRTLLMIFEVMK